jgi:hypothetical protein
MDISVNLMLGIQIPIVPVFFFFFVFAFDIFFLNLHVVQCHTQRITAWAADFETPAGQQLFFSIFFSWADGQKQTKIFSMLGF